MATQCAPPPACSSSSRRIDTQRPAFHHYIPEDIQLKILKHLPVLTLLRSRCVCKLWKQVIDSETFIQDHLALQKDHYTIIECGAPEYLAVDPRKLQDFEVLSFPKTKPERPLRVLGTLHGIICLYDDICCKIVLWNPCIRKTMIVGPTSPSFNWYPYYVDKYPVGPSCGFWIDPLTKEFKIVMFQMSEYEEDDCIMYAYSSTRGDWKKIHDDEHLEEFCYNGEPTAAVVIDNVGHWTVYYDYRDDMGHEMLGIMVLLFDFKKEVFLESIGALDIKLGWNRPVVCNRDGALSLVYMDPYQNSYDVFLWKEGKWIKVHNFCMSTNLERFIWWKGDEEDRERQTRVVAAITGGLLSNESDDMLSCCALMKPILEYEEIIIVNGLVESLLFPVAECLEDDSCIQSN